MFGIDVSNNNGSIDWNKVKTSNVEIALIKATESNWFKDKYLKANYNGAKANGIKVGIYHFFRCDRNAREQAEFFVNYIKEVGATNYDCKLCLDIETTEGQSGNTITTMAVEFLERVKELTGKEVMIYTGPSFANSYLDNRLSKYPCWIAHYGVSKPMSTKVWESNYAGHQYSSTGRINGVSGNCDINNFTDAVLLGITTNTANISSPVTSTITPHDYLGTEFKRKLVQHILNALGYNLVVDGIIGTKSVAAIKNYQSKKGLVVDGLVGKNTFRAFMGDMQGITCFKSNIRTNPNRVVQHMLSCTADGIFGSITETAVRNFQSRSGIGVDGIVGPVTWSRLFGAYI